MLRSSGRLLLYPHTRSLPSLPRRGEFCRRIFYLPPSYGVLPKSTGLLSAQLQTVQQIMTADASQDSRHASGSNILTQPFLPQEIPRRKRRDLHAHNPHTGLLSLPPQSAQSPGMAGGPNGLASQPSVGLHRSSQENPHQEKVDVQRQKSPIASNRGILSGSYKPILQLWSSPISYSSWRPSRDWVSVRSPGSSRFSFRMCIDRWTQSVTFQVINLAMTFHLELNCAQLKDVTMRVPGSVCSSRATSVVREPELSALDTPMLRPFCDSAEQILLIQVDWR